MNPIDILSTLYDDLANCIDNACLNGDLEWDEIKDLDTYELSNALSPYGRGLHVSGLLRAIHVIEQEAGIILTTELCQRWHYSYRDQCLPTYRFWALSSLSPLLNELGKDL